MLTITREQLKRFAPNALTEYVETLLANLDILRHAGILDTNLRLAHFLAQCWAETGGFTIKRESMRYSLQRYRDVFPRYTRNLSDGHLRGILADPIETADLVYGGRMGNKKGTPDGYDYRGAWWIQTTGKGAMLSYCTALGIEPSPRHMDDPVMTLRFACVEWAQGNCNKWADLNDVLRVSRVINVGSAESGVTPNGMNHRKEGLARALAVWGNAPHLAAVSDVQPDQVKSRTIDNAGIVQKAGEGLVGGSLITAVVEKATAPAQLPPVPLTPKPGALPELTEIANQVGVIHKLMEAVGTVAKFAIANWWISLTILGAVLIYVGRKQIALYIEDIRTGKRTPIFKLTGQVLGAPPAVPAIAPPAAEPPLSPGVV